ncbi:extracellular solute-binding protein [Treponema sp. OttesenSCG-928-L16]|nr:extracellular solute-binding protein [Treponema sp. OttesenSCG-928-L16]
MRKNTIINGNYACLLISVLLLCVGLCSCSDQGKKTSGQNTKTDELITIDFWYTPAVSEAGAPPADWIAYKLIREKLNIDLKLSPLSSDANDRDMKLNAAGAANSLPDFFSVRRATLTNLVKQGLVAPVDDLYALMPDRSAKMYDDTSRAFTSINGKSYGFSTSTGDIRKNEGILIRKDWLDNLGLSVPVSLDEYMNVMKAFTYRDPDGNGKNDTWGYGTFIEVTNYEEGLGRRLDPFFGAFGVAGTWNLSKADPGLNIRKPGYYHALAYIKSMVDEAVMDPNWLSNKKDDFKASWKQGRFGIMREQNASYAAESNYAPFDKNFPNGEWIVIDPPTGPEGKQSVGVYTTSTENILAISAKAGRDGKGPAIARLLEWMSSDEGYYIIGWGEEGVNFVFDGNGVPVTEGLPDPSKAFTKPEMQPLTQLKGLAYYWGEAELLSRYPTYTTAVSGKTMSALTTLREMQARPWTRNAGAETLPSPNSDIKRFYEQGVVEFVTGKRDLTPENWKKYIEQFDAMGGAAWEEAGIKSAADAGFLY